MSRTWITICETCKREGWAEGDMAQTDGEALARLVEPLAEAAGVPVRRVACTMGCERACNVIVQAEGKTGYSLGRFLPDRASAEALVAYALLHQASETGQVPFRTWPEGVKGHFVSRHLPVPE